VMYAHKALTIPCFTIFARSANNDPFAQGSFPSFLEQAHSRKGWRWLRQMHSQERFFLFSQWITFLFLWLRTSTIIRLLVHQTHIFVDPL